ncbi:MAG: hypothetical protein K5837_00250 [Candidatus Saccharibacteria bacterium]|nr:hypothetical protein [Candidatus Saccharibacteria bacterium]
MIIIQLKPVVRNKNREQALVFSFFVAGDEGYKQCAVVASDRALGDPPRGEFYSVIKDKKHTLRGVSLSLMAGTSGCN